MAAATSATTAAAAAADDPVASQASSHFPLEPISAAVLCRKETKRRDALKKRGPVRVGCPEIDEYVLMGGLERGSVVGLSAESEQMGLLISMQALANDLCSGDARAMIVTTQPPAAVLPMLRDAVKAEMAAREVPAAEVKDKLRACLERVSVSRVFDLDGVWEVLGDLDIPPESPGSEGSLMSEIEDALEPPMRLPSELEEEQNLQPEPERIVLPDLKPNPVPRAERTEIADSDNEDAFSLPPSSSSELSPPPSSMLSMLATPEAPENMEIPEADAHETQSPGPQDVDLPVPPEVAAQAQESENRNPTKEGKELTTPDIILITHFSTLMTALFTRHDRGSAHDSLQYLSSHLRYLSRNLPSSPLIMLLNSTSSSKNKPSAESNPANLANITEDMQPPPPLDEMSSKHNKPLDPTLRSVFNPPPLNIPGYTGQALSRRNKPTFGLVFSQILDLHLLCTRVPRTKADADRLYAPSDVEDDETVKYTLVLEVLLDEMGVWEIDSTQEERKLREQRWAPVDVRAGRIVDAFDGAAEKKKNEGNVRVVGGFGGPRV
ncbi:uncharacterized protein CTRU02_207100 [Colletotrichum truncatum]|uniref:Uncharacterized protein n=1 Tax=Colletotrichum truncatum TaxID=5467 RepID=A0ACC3YZZ7_COLTU|nr:uncharacterized protein CTRU02_01275 [Colletotrichum truncatum]KAF6800870.1 hypothetical protein CTRU02_01275 [Colletotrichum truncatum]